jgi:hypothetical protein
MSELAQREYLLLEQAEQGGHRRFTARRRITAFAYVKVPAD